MPSDSERPQDVGRDRKRRGSPSAATLAVLADYRATLRVELVAVLGELATTKPADLDRRSQLVGLAVKVARELASGSDGAEGRASVASDATRGKAPKLTRRDRASLE